MKVAMPVFTILYTGVKMIMYLFGYKTGVSPSKMNPYNEISLGNSIIR